MHGLGILVTHGSEAKRKADLTKYIQEFHNTQTKNWKQTGR